VNFTAVRAGFPGFLVCATIAAAASFLSGHYGGPPMLFAVLLGLALGSLRDAPTLDPGIEFASRSVLRLGVALLGLRITFGDILEMGTQAVTLVVVGMVTTIVLGVLGSRAMGLGRSFGALTGGSVAVCGVSAAMAISAVLPRTQHSARDMSFAVIGVTTLSTLAMILYPLVVAALSFDDRQAGLFLGATIHDVAQVVGAGYSVSAPAGDAATFTKLLRVALLLPIVIVLALTFRARASAETPARRPPLLPWFLVVFAILVIVNSLVTLPAVPKESLQQFAQMCLITAVAALGIRTSLKDLAAMGIRPVLLIVGETLYLAVLSIVLLLWLT
jgi:uncharacterized integral membrane protein (TIGR00698 family)